MPSFSATKNGYRNLWNRMRFTRSTEINKAATGIIADRTRYEVAEARTGVPWFWIALVHLRESARDFRGILHNGEKIIGTGRVTSLVPKGRGPFATWEEAAEDALKYMGLDKIDDWPLERCLYEFERYNGWGYFGKVNSPYLWAGTSLYTRGKYVADGKYDPNHVDQQLGLAAVLRRLVDISDDVAERLDMLVAEPSPLPEPVPVDPLDAYTVEQLISELLSRPLVKDVMLQYGQK